MIGSVVGAMLAAFVYVARQLNLIACSAVEPQAVHEGAYGNHACI